MDTPQSVHGDRILRNILIQSGYKMIYIWSLQLHVYSLIMHPPQYIISRWDAPLCDALVQMALINIECIVQ